VQHHYELVLARLYALGAFAGASPRDAYLVNTGPSVNTPESMDRGMFIVELRVAPSQPLVFLTVRLVQSDRTGLTIQES
jgi:phage tail sheath protein FI